MGLNINKEYLFDYFAGHATVLQKQMIEEWIKDPDNEEMFYECLHEWESTKSAIRVDTVAALERYNLFIKGDYSLSKKPGFSESNENAINKSTNSLRYMMAACVVFIAITFAWFFKEQFFFKTYKTDYGETMSLILPDGSSVALNANSQLKVPRWGFEAAIRKVVLKGEANFSIVHTSDNKRFIVETDTAFKVEVLGTEFNVFARRNNYKVVLIKGKVRLSYKRPKHEEKAVLMSPGEIISLNDKGNINTKKILHPEKYTEWKNQKMLFESTPMKEVIMMLEDNYGLQVEIRDQYILDQTLTGSFQAKTADDLLQALSEILEINVIRKENKVILIDN